MKLAYFIAPLVTLITAVAGSLLTSGGMIWYASIKVPSWTPPGSVIGMVWTTIFILSTVAAILFLGAAGAGERRVWVIVLFLANAVLNILWSLLFFNLHLMGAAAFEAAALGLSVVALIVLIWPVSVPAAVLLMPYAGWVAFATYLTVTVRSLNR